MCPHGNRFLRSFGTGLFFFSIDASSNSYGDGHSISEGGVVLEGKSSINSSSKQIRYEVDHYLDRRGPHLPL